MHWIIKDDDDDDDDYDDDDNYDDDDYDDNYDDDDNYADDDLHHLYCTIYLLNTFIGQNNSVSVVPGSSGKYRMRIEP